ncbi:MAG: DNA recombination protein RmuC [Pseudomonadota bacterium]
MQTDPLFIALGAVVGALVAALAVYFWAASRLHQRALTARELEARSTGDAERLQQFQAQLADRESELHQLRGELADWQRRHDRMETTLAEKERHFDQQLKLLEDNKQQLKQEFQNLANRIFEDKGKAFNELSQQSLDQLLKPFKDQLKDFRSKVEDIHHKDTQQQASLTEQIKSLRELNQQITEEAKNLTTALKGEKKTQGNWGEYILENILDKSGLVLGRDYEREVSLKTDDGQRQRPDAVIYLPQGKHLIIDAKVSLNDWTRYIEAEDDAERKVALKGHIDALKARVKELSDKNYFELPGLNSPEVVFMFVPIESAFAGAVSQDRDLPLMALENNVLIATPTTLLTSLNIVRQLWRFEDQSKHSALLAEKAGKVYDKLRTFVESLEKLGSQLGGAQKSYDKAMGQLTNGPGNLIKQASEFRDLGVSVRAELPSELVDKAHLELEHYQQEERDDE